MKDDKKYLQRIANELSVAESELNRAVGQFSVIAGGTYMGSLREYKKLVRHHIGITDIRMLVQRELIRKDRRKSVGGKG